MNHHEENNDAVGTTDVYDLFEERLYDCLKRYPSVFLKLEDASWILGPEHPTVKLMREALQSLDEDRFEAAQRAFYTSPKKAMIRARNPWIEHTPPPGTRKNFRYFQIPELAGESSEKDWMRCYLQFTAKEGGYDPQLPPDEDGHVVNPALVQDSRIDDWPVRVQILEDSDPMVVRDLLKKILHKLEQDWDELTNPDSYPHDREPEAW